MEHRWGQRRQTNVTVRFVTMPSTTGIGRLVDISSTGAFMETSVNLRLLSLLYLELAEQPSGDGINGRLAATVVRRSAAGVGLEWCEFAAETTQAYACLARGWRDSGQLPLPSIPDAR
ncbi:MAG: PilZ domain-containing protein [Pseudomonadota bacterium]|nr:PilZ domain-containing protein [Pseudomonadota bacterium]